MHKFAKTFLLASLAYQAQPIKLLEYIDPQSLQNIQSNTMVILNEDIELYLKLQFKANKCYLKETQGLEDFDIIAINKYGILPFSIKNDQDQLRLRKYFQPLEHVTSKDEAIKQLTNNWTSLILSYIPEDRMDLEEQYQNINFRDINNNAQYLIIRDAVVAQQFNLGKNDIGEVFNYINQIYVLKQSSIVINNESSFQYNGKEYSFNKVDADPNSENADDLRHKVLDRNIIAQLGETLGIDLLKSTYRPTKPYQIDKVIQRIGLQSQGYINIVENIQEMEDILQLVQLHSINYMVIYTNAHQSYEEKHLKKLIKFKKSLPISQQQQVMIMQLKSPVLQRKYFGIIESDIESQIRFIDLQQRQQDQEGEKQYTFHQMQQKAIDESNYQNNVRYLFDSKITSNRLVEYFKNLKEQYYEYTDGQQPTKFITKNAQDTLPDEYLLLYYKRNCLQCKDLQKSLEKIDINLPLIRINILNESQQPCPSRTPQVLIKKNGQIKHAQLEKKNIAATDVQALQYYLNRL